jgi:hypothetical protein
MTFKIKGIAPLPKGGPGGIIINVLIIPLNPPLEKGDLKKSLGKCVGMFVI